jgi:hypothetical protein
LLANLAAAAEAGYGVVCPPFVRAGVSYPITGGSVKQSGDVGFFGSAGVEFYRNRRVSLGVELGHDSAQVTVNANLGGPDRKATPIGFNAGIFVMFGG